MPSGVAGVPAPFIWGPVGGSTHVLPKAMKESLPRVFRRHETTRWLFQTCLGRLRPVSWRLTRHRADLILTYSEEALAGIPARHRHKARVDRPHRRSRVRYGDRGRATTAAPTFTVVSGGRLVHWKGFDLLVRGFRKFVEETRRTPVSCSPAMGRIARFSRASRGARAGRTCRFLGILPSRADVYRIWNVLTSMRCQR